MEIFDASLTTNSSTLSSFLNWLMVASVLIFSSVCIKGGYARWAAGKETSLGVFFDVVLVVTLIVFVGITLQES